MKKKDDEEEQEDGEEEQEDGDGKIQILVLLVPSCEDISDPPSHHVVTHRGPSTHEVNERMMMEEWMTCSFGREWLR